MSFSSAESASCAHVVWVMRNACAPLVFSGEAQKTRIATVVVFCQQSLRIDLFSDMEVKVAAGVTTSRSQRIKTRAGKKPPVPSSRAQ